ncbi:MAG: cob(I)yrinic acid a,c-diamide adenosyltransferase [bacterium]
MLYTGKGDDGQTTLFHCEQRFSKSSIVAEALGSLDELNSFLGVVKAKLAERNITLYSVGPERAADIIQEMQENLFIIQAEVAGVEKTVSEEKIKEVEDLIAGIGKEIPPINSFVIPGVSIESAEIDFARTLARKVERRVVAVNTEGFIKVSANTLAYLNRLSSLLFALARLSAHKSGIQENSPSYK